MDPKAHENVHRDEVNHHGVGLIACVDCSSFKKKKVRAGTVLTGPASAGRESRDHEG